MLLYSGSHIPYCSFLAFCKVLVLSAFKDVIRSLTHSIKMSSVEPIAALEPSRFRCRGRHNEISLSMAILVVHFDTGYAYNWLC